MRSKRWWRWAWGAWAAASAGSFVVLESAALRRNCHPTLSTTLRRAMGIHPRHKWGTATLAALTAFWVWLVVHLAVVPDDIYFGDTPPAGFVWAEVSPGLWYRVPRRRSLI